MDMLPVETTAGPDRLRTGSDEIVILATSEQTGGALFAIEVTMQPGGGAPLMHRHDPGEVYHVLEGEFTFYLDDQDSAVRRVTATAGDVVPLAGKTPHAIRNESDARAVAFVVHAPGPPMENFCRGVAGMGERAADMEAVLAVAEDNGIEMLGPIPA